MSGPADPGTGVKIFAIAGRMIDRRQRCLGMTDEERRWRAQWLKDQVLDPEEPRFVPEYYKETTNFMRRLYKTPMHKLELFLGPIVGANKAYYIRHTIGKSFMGVLAAFALTYFFKYHTNDFVVHRPVIVFCPYKRMYPDDPDYPNVPVRPKIDYFHLGFYTSVLCQEVKYVEPEEPEEPEPPSQPPTPASVSPTAREDGSDSACPARDKEE